MERVSTTSRSWPNASMLDYIAASMALTPASRDIEDDGRGFDSTNTAAPVGTGIVGMRERAALAGGTLDVESRAGDGPAIAVRVPTGDIESPP
jgi:signal transduction histidine kinase